MTFVDASAVDTEASFTLDGVYVLRLTAYDGELTAYDEVTITVNPDPPGNQMPFVSAGLDQTITLPAIAILDGTVSDDGLPNPPGGLTITWSTASGPGEVIFLNASIVDTTVNFSVAGIYVLRLTANDGELTAYDDVILTVEPVPSTNQKPIVSAGLDQIIIFPESVQLTGTVSDDGLPDPPCLVTTTWSKVSGPGSVYFIDSNSVETRVGFSIDGQYVLRLTGNDSELSAYDEVIVTVKPAHQVAFIYLPILVMK